MDGLNRDLDLHGATSPRAMPQLGEWGPVGVPSGGEKRRQRWMIVVYFVLAVVAVTALGSFAYLMLS